jgi:predicted nucleotide-binding protein
MYAVLHRAPEQCQPKCSNGDNRHPLQASKVYGTVNVGSRENSMGRLSMEDDHMLRWPHSREIIRRIISGEMKELGTHNEAKVNEYIELFSAYPSGFDGVFGDPEPNALRVIVRVDKFEKGEGKSPNFVHWRNSVRKSEPDESRTAEEIDYMILLALRDIGGAGGTYTPAEILAEATGISLQDVEDHIALLRDEDKVRSVVSSSGTAAYMQPRGRLHLREMAMSKKPTKSLPRRIFISHGRSGDWREVQDYVQREIRFDTLELAQEPSQGRTILQKLDEESTKCGYAVIVMTGDDRVGEEVRARENVMHEIGFFQGRYGLDRVCLLYEQGVNRPSNIHGLVPKQA